MRFQDKIVLITGASSGIGEVAAHAFAGEGARVFLAARREEKGEGVAKSIRSKGGVATFFKADMQDRGQIRAMIQSCVDTYGGLDVALNNAGIEGGAFIQTHEYPVDTWDDVIAINLTGVWLCMRSQIPAMLASGGGSIVNMSSLAGVKGFGGSSAYAASKFGVEGITKAAALEYAQENIRVNSVCPAVIQTAMADRVFFSDGTQESRTQTAASHPMNRIGTPEEVVSAVLWLASDDSSFVTGESINVAGGLGA